MIPLKQQISTDTIFNKKVTILSSKLPKCQLLLGASIGHKAPNVNLGPYIIAETTRAKKAEITNRTRHGQVLISDIKCFPQGRPRT